MLSHAELQAHREVEKPARVSLPPEHRRVRISSCEPDASIRLISGYMLTLFIRERQKVEIFRTKVRPIARGRTARDEAQPRRCRPTPPTGSHQGLRSGPRLPCGAPLCPERLSDLPR